MSDTYRKYFNIDPEYFPQVNEDVIRKSPDVWKKFYPHPTFVKLLKDTVSVLERKNKQCLWVEGAYGTGKSHAVLTLKKLLDADAAEVQEYFEKFAGLIDTDLRRRLMALKNSGRILTVHRYGSSSIRNDQNLFFAIQESVEKALKDAGIAGRGRESQKDAVIAWLSKQANRKYFNDLIAEEPSGPFRGDSADGVVEKLKSFEGNALQKLMDGIFAMADRYGMRFASLDADDLVSWLREVIRSNGLKAIFFIWDEFSEYFYNNMRSLTGFQRLCEMSMTDPFYLAIVTHLSQAVAGEGNQDFKKLNDRFVSPHCRIELPENIAFQLMGAAMEKTGDPALRREWKDMRGELANRTLEARRLVAKSVNIDERDLLDILPLHPYAALLLKHIAATFESNQRSMFDFIKNDRGDEIRGFQWFIDNCGPYDDNPLLTVDMLWDFFYEKGKENLSRDVRSVLDYYGRVEHEKQLHDDEKRVLKTVLMLQAVSLRAGGAVELFIPDEKSIANAFEGSDLQGGVISCAKKLAHDKILYSKSLGGGKSKYAAYLYNDDVDPEPHYKQIDMKSTGALISSEDLGDKTYVKDAISLDGALKLRYELRCVGGTDFDSQVKKLVQDTADNKIAALVCFARDMGESLALNEKIKKWRQNANARRVVFIDASGTPFGPDYKFYREELALSMAYLSVDRAESQQHASDAREFLRRWKNRVANGEFYIYSMETPAGGRCASFEELKSALERIARSRFPSSPFSEYTVIKNMYAATSMKQGVKCGCKQKVSGTFLAPSPNTKLERALTGAWGIQRYWESNPLLLISKIKKRVDEVVHEGFSGESARVSIKDIWSALKEPPFGMIACNLSAFIMGFVLKEYVDAGSYSFYDGVTNDALSDDKLSQMVDEVLKLDNMPNQKYREKYIVTVTAEQKAFYELTSKAFGIQQNLCVTVADAVNLIRNKMKEFRFPLWTVKKLLVSAGTKTDKEVLERIIDGYCGIANTNNAGGQTENRIAQDLGRKAQEHPLAGDDLEALFSAEKCTQGMAEYLETFEGGKLPKLARMVDDKGQYINVLRAKFDAADATWLWNIDTADQKIRETILEYSIVEQSNRVIPKSTSYSDAVAAWCNVCANIKVSYDAAEGDLGDCAAFFKMLRDMKTSNGYLPDARKSEFLELLKQNAQAFLSLYNNQRELFRRVCSFYLSGIDGDGDGVQEIFKKIPSGVFTMGKSDYFAVIERIASEYKNSLEANKLRELWRRKTGTGSPAEWCRVHEMPILCLIPDGELDSAKAAFDALNSRNPASAAVNRAIEYLEGAEFFGCLGDMDALDKAFIDRIVKGNSVMLDDVNEVKRFLVSQLGAEAYNWWNNLPRIDGLLGKLAQDKYFKGGSDRALAKIDEMSPEDLKKYLKELIKDNVVVGMEIIKGN